MVRRRTIVGRVLRRLCCDRLPTVIRCDALRRHRICCRGLLLRLLLVKDTRGRRETSPNLAIRWGSLCR